jgi:carboxypeptidase D
MVILYIELSVKKMRNKDKKIITIAYTFLLLSTFTVMFTNEIQASKQPIVTIDIQKTVLNDINNLYYDILEYDKQLNNNIKIGLPSSKLNGFHDYPSLTLELQQIASNYSNITSLYNLGSSVQGRTIWGLKITDNPDIEENEAEVRICGAHHGDELMSVELPLMLAWHLVQNYTSNATIAELIDNREIWIIPLVNPDGRMSSPPKRRNANNVDLNRDYGYIWEPISGSNAPFSQIETQIMRQNALENNYVLSLSFHTSGDVINYIWNHKGTPVADHDVVVNLSNMYEVNNGYWVVEGYDWYRITGDTNDFSYGCRGDIDWTIEVQNNNIPVAWDLNRDGMLGIIDAADMGLTGIVTDNITGEPIAATIWVEEAYWPCFTDPIIGDYHKPLLPGNYTVHFRANNYQEKVLTVQVTDPENPTILNATLDRNNERYAYQITWYYCYDPYSYPHDYQENPTEGISALGPPDNVFASIGKSGEIVLDMGIEGIISNGSGDDFIVFEGDSSPEGYYVEVSENWNGPWTSLGYGTGTSSFDLANGSIDNVQFVKIIDDNDGDASEPNPGFDLDAIQVLSNDTNEYLITDILSNWNFVSLPFNKTINKNDIIIYDNTSVYNWSEAASSNVVSDFIFGWNRSNQVYTIYDTLNPGYGFWIFSYKPCELRVQNISFSQGNYITNLKTNWNIIGIPDNKTLNKNDILVNGYSWSEAVNYGIISDFVYSWNKTTQSYYFIDTITSGNALWTYAYTPCELKY